MTENDNYEAEILVLRQLRDLLERQGHSLDSALKLMRRTGTSQELIDKALGRLRDLQNGAIRGGPNAGALIRGIGAVAPWYAGPSNEHLYWPKLRDHLKTTGWSESDLSGLDRSSDRVLASCQSPWELESNGRGLVVGYVQSGKTTNFTAVMAKAADAGFRLFIVLSGTTKALRKQTQIRLDEQLRDLEKNSWVFLTDIKNDFGHVPGMGPVLHNISLRTCVVVKKNKSRLKRLNKFLDDAQSQGQLSNCPILIIDDEGDQASLSPNCDPVKASVINKEIVKLTQRPRVSYVAYTATPFANVFVNPNFEENLYPRDFIYSMEEPESYFGARRTFGTGPDDAELDIVREISVEEEPHYFGKDAPAESPSLRSALQWFLLANTARRIRLGGNQPHSTMLINLSERIQSHRDVWPIVRDIVVDIQNLLLQNDSQFCLGLRKQWDTESTTVKAETFNNVKISFDEIHDGSNSSELLKTIEMLGSLTGKNSDSNPDCGIIVDNSEAQVRLAYEDESPRPIIVIGGNVLSRGLTLEGLVCSVFARSTKLYDSLLQMGRWFGYRRGYEDLQRVWMFKEVSDRFEFLARIEIEIRDEIARYESTGLSPIDFGVRIRVHPQMQITRQSMMKKAISFRADFSGTRPQATFYDNKIEDLVRALDATNDLIASIQNLNIPAERIGSKYLFRNVPLRFIQKFYDPATGLPLSDANEYFKNPPLTEYLIAKNIRGEIQEWNVVFESVNGRKVCEDINGLQIHMAGRTRRRSTLDRDTLSIGSLAGKDDGLLDVPSNYQGSKVGWRDVSKIPLLVIHIIDKDTKAKTNDPIRVDLSTHKDLVGTAIYFPILSSEDLGVYQVVDGPWNIRPIGDEDEDNDQEDLENDTEGDEVPNLRSL